MPVAVLALSRHRLAFVHRPDQSFAHFREVGQLWAGERHAGTPSDPSVAHSLEVLEHALLDKDTESPEVQVLVEMRALEQIFDSYSKVPGRKKLIWLSVAFPFRFPSFTPAGMKDGDPAKPIAARVWKVITQENVLVYGMYRPGLNINWDSVGNASSINWIDPVFGCGFASGPAVFGSPSQPRNVCHEEPAECVRRFINDARDYYLLGFYLHDHKAGWHKVTVKSRRGLKLASKKTFFVNEDSSAGSRPRD